MKNKFEEQLISICPYCLNKFEIKKNIKDTHKFEQECPHCKRKFYIEVEEKIILHSKANKKDLKIDIELKKEIENFYNQKEKSIKKETDIKNIKIN